MAKALPSGIGSHAQIKGNAKGLGEQDVSSSSSRGFATDASVHLEHEPQQKVLCCELFVVLHDAERAVLGGLLLLWFPTMAEVKRCGDGPP